MPVTEFNDIKNRYKRPVIFFLLLSLVFLSLCIIPFADVGIPFVKSNWSLVFLAFFGFLSSVLISYILYSRLQILKSMIAKTDFISSWRLSAAQIKAYSEHLYLQNVARNKFLYILAVTLIVLIFGILLFVIEDERMLVLMILVILLSLITLAAFFIPIYYRFRNLNGDGLVILGRRGVYVNGYLHTWIFPLSGLKSIKAIKNPFLGIECNYHYTDRTGVHTHILSIPTPENIDPNSLIA